MREETTGMEIAIIGMSGKFPGARNIAEYWKNLINGEETISFFTKEELLNNQVPEELINNPEYVAAKGIVPDIEYFDSEYFGYFPKEVEVMDPQLRLLHECVNEALEDAGYCSFKCNKTIGMFIGAASNYGWKKQTFLSDTIKESEKYNAWLLGDENFMATRLSYNFNLTGPSISSNTACSTSLVTVDTACKNLLTGACDMAVAGGVSLNYPTVQGYLYQEGSIASPDGHCRPFDEEAAGTLESEGIGIVVLKRLEDAINDQDHIYAIIKGSATNNDGDQKVGYTAPSVDGQINVMRAAYYMADVEPETIQYIEAHGTGTNLGDPIEIEALRDVFGSNTTECKYVGSVKGNIGHLNTAAGIASLIKAVLILKHKMIPPTLNFKVPNPKINFEQSPFKVNTSVQPLLEQEYPLRAGVSSFGIGGTNAHIILEEYKEELSCENDSKEELLLVSAMNEELLESYSKRILKEVNELYNFNLRDVCYTMAVGRRDCPYRKGIVLSQTGEIKSETNYIAPKEEHLVYFKFKPSKVTLLDKWYYENTYMRSIIDENREIIENSYLDKELINGFMTQYIYAKYLLHIGIKPCGIIGGQTGQLITDCLSEKISLQEALTKINNIDEVVSDEVVLEPHHILIDMAMTNENIHEALLDTLVHLWGHGIQIDWEKVYEDTKRVSLSSYPFSKKKYDKYMSNHMESGDNKQSKVGIKLEKKSNWKEWLYLESWKPSLLEYKSQPAQKYFVIGEMGISATYKVIEEIEKSGVEVIESSFSTIKDDLKNIEGQVEVLYFNLAEYHQYDNMPQQVEENFFRIQQLIKEIGQLEKEISLSIVVQNSFSIGTEKSHNVGNSLMLGLVRVATQEYRQLHVRVIDAGDILKLANTQLVKCIGNEILHGDKEENFIAYRGKTRYVESFIPAVQEGNEIINRIKTNGVYVITGGLGNIGLSIADYLASKNAKIILIQRTQFLDVSEWEDWLNVHSEKDTISCKIRKLLALKSKGIQVDIKVAHMENSQEVLEVMETIKKQYGNIDGIFYSAGLVNKEGFKGISELDRITAEKHFNAKVYGVINLQQALSAYNLTPQFCILMSSISTIVGGLGFSAYASANYFLSTFANYENMVSEIQWSCIEWEGWEDSNDSTEKIKSSVSQYMLTHKEGMHILDYILHTDLPERVIISTGNLNQRISAFKEEQQKNMMRMQNMKDRKQVNTVNTSNVTEIELCELIKDYFDIDELSIDDNIFEMGGSSLDAIELSGLIKKELHCELSTSTLFSYPTVRTLVEYINKADQRVEEPIVNRKSLLQRRKLVGRK